VYHSDRHVINLFTWPASGKTSLTVTSRQGFHAVHWTQAGMTWWAVSDVAEVRLRRFAELLGYASREATP
jgi:anti-sigma factor RsiW